MDYYKILEIPVGSSIEEVKAAYIKLALKYHPDKNPGHEAWATEKFKEIQEAYEYLSNSRTRVGVRDQFDPFSVFREDFSTFSPNVWDMLHFASQKRKCVSEIKLSFNTQLSSKDLSKIIEIVKEKGYNPVNCELEIRG